MVVLDRSPLQLRGNAEDKGPPGRRFLYPKQCQDQ